MIIKTSVFELACAIKTMTYIFVFSCFRELFENLIAPKGQKLTSTELNQLAELLVLKDNELKSTLNTGKFTFKKKKN